MNGRQAYTSRAKLKRTRDAYLEDRDKLMDLSEELATLRAIFQEFLDVFADPNQDDYGIHLNRVIKIISTMGTLVDKISKIESRNKITAAEVMYLQATVADLLIKYIHDPVQQEQAVKELVMRFASDGVEDLIALEKRPALPSGDEDR